MVNTTVLPSGQTTPCQREDPVFDTWQPRYAARGIPTFPVRFEVLPSGKVDKVPMVKHWQSFGLRGSTALTRGFADAQGIGIALGTRNGLAVVDVDTRDENVVADVLSYYGPSPLIARSPSGGHHIYYRHNGRQRRRIRDSYWQERGAPVDVLGNGLIVAPASRAPTGVYRFIQGDIDDLQRLPVLPASAGSKAPPPGVAKAKAKPEARPSPTAKAKPEARPSPLRGMREHDGRNNALFMAIGAVARTIHASGGTRDDLLEIAREHNMQCTEPMEENEVSTIVGNVWGMTQLGHNHIGQHGVWLNVAEVETMVRQDPDALTLLTYLRLHNGPWGHFWVANGLADTLGWPPKRMAAARRRLIELGHLVPARQAGRGTAALYKWRGT
jgi:hypothetical protein